MDMKQMMRQAQKMQKQLNVAQEEIATMTYEATAGGGMVKAVAAGDMSIKSLEIDPEVAMEQKQAQLEKAQQQYDADERNLEVFNEEALTLNNKFLCLNILNNCISAPLA